MKKDDLINLIRKGIYYSPLSWIFLYRYRYKMTPAELCVLCDCINKTKNVYGKFLELGCYAGFTTVFLNKYMDCQNIQKDYICIDTFSGFTKSDVAFEKQKREKKEIPKFFAVNSEKRFKQTMKLNGIKRVKSFKADVNKFDFSKLGNISFCLIDVDLYQPVINSLNGVYNLISNGGIIVVDDCIPNTVWDGAYEAYLKFTSRNSIKIEIIEGLGIIRKK